MGCLRGYAHIYTNEGGPRHPHSDDATPTLLHTRRAHPPPMSPHKAPNDALIPSPSPPCNSNEAKEGATQPQTQVPEIWTLIRSDLENAFCRMMRYRSMRNVEGPAPGLARWLAVLWVSGRTILWQCIEHRWYRCEATRSTTRTPERSACFCQGHYLKLLIVK